MKKWVAVLAVMIMSLTIMACGKTEDIVPEAENIVSETETENAEMEEAEAPVEETEVPAEEVKLEDIASLLGMSDAETADHFGGGEENWTEDKSFYIGRMYQVSLYGESMPLYTSCDDEKTVNAVSLWIANGEREVTGEEAEQWVQRVTEFAEAEPTYNDTSSEAGSKVWKWNFDGKVAAVYWTGDILSLNMNPAVGELK